MCAKDSQVLIVSQYFISFIRFIGFISFRFYKLTGVPMYFIKIMVNGVFRLSC